MEFSELIQKRYSVRSGSSQNSGVSLRVPHVQRKLVGESSQSCGNHRHGQ
jgi:hypothetical protein